MRLPAKEMRAKTSLVPQSSDCEHQATKHFTQIKQEFPDTAARGAGPRLQVPEIFPCILDA